MSSGGGTPTHAFRVGVTRDIRESDRVSVYPLDLLDQSPGVTWTFLSEETYELAPEHVDGFDAMIVERPRVTAATLDCANPPILMARTGVGLDSVDLVACTVIGTIVTVTPDAVRRPMASSALSFMLALSHCLPQRERLLRSGQWEIFAYIGTALTGRTLGVLGLGNIGRELCNLVSPFDMRVIALDPFVEEAGAGIALVDLETLLREADFLAVTCPLTDETRHMLDAPRLALMKRTAYVVNVARGPIIDQLALTQALKEGRLAGAALDVLEPEPIAPDDPLLELENVILTPHAIGMTDEMLAGTGKSASESVLAVSSGQLPRYIANPDVLDHPRIRERMNG